MTAIVVGTRRSSPSSGRAFYDLHDRRRRSRTSSSPGCTARTCSPPPSCRRASATRTHERCRFCTIEESLRAGATIAVKTPAQLAEVAEAAVRLDGVAADGDDHRHVERPRPGRQHLARCVRAAVEGAVPGLPIQVQSEPPLDLAWIGELHAAGADAIGIHVESLDDDVRERWMPGKATVPLWRVRRGVGPRPCACSAATEVSTYLLVGLGEDPDELVAGAERADRDGRLPVRRAVPPARRDPRPTSTTSPRRCRCSRDVTDRVAARAARRRHARRRPGAPAAPRAARARPSRRRGADRCSTSSSSSNASAPPRHRRRARCARASSSSTPATTPRRVAAYRRAAHRGVRRRAGPVRRATTSTTTTTTRARRCSSPSARTARCSAACGCTPPSPRAADSAGGRAAAWSCGPGSRATRGRHRRRAGARRVRGGARTRARCASTRRSRTARSRSSPGWAGTHVRDIVVARAAARAHALPDRPDRGSSPRRPRRRSAELLGDVLARRARWLGRRRRARSPGTDVVACTTRSCPRWSSATRSGPAGARCWSPRTTSPRWAPRPVGRARRGRRAATPRPRARVIAGLRDGADALRRARSSAATPSSGCRRR